MRLPRTSTASARVTTESARLAKPAPSPSSRSWVGESGLAARSRPPLRLATNCCAISPKLGSRSLLQTSKITRYCAAVAFGRFFCESFRSSTALTRRRRPRCAKGPLVRAVASRVTPVADATSRACSAMYPKRRAAAVVKASSRPRVSPRLPVGFQLGSGGDLPRQVRRESHGRLGGEGGEHGQSRRT